MKKTLFTTLLAGAVCASSLQAGVTWGLTSAKLSNNGSNVGFSLGVQKLFYQPEKLKGFGIGALLDMDYFTLDKTTNLDSDIGMLVNGDILLGYSYQNATLLTGYGYGLGKIGSETYEGANYMFALEYNFNKSSAIGVKYKNNEVDLTLGGSDQELEITSIYYKKTY